MHARTQKAGCGKVGDGAGSRIVSPFEMARTRQVARERVDDADVSQSEERHVDSITGMLGGGPRRADVCAAVRVPSGVQCLVEGHADAGSADGLDGAAERVAAEEQPVLP